MTTNDWHVDDDLWARYAAGSLDQVADAAIEAHVAACGHCRDGARAAVPAEDLAAAWPAIAAGLSPRERASTRWLRRVRVPDPDAVVLGASDGLHLPWIVAVVEHGDAAAVERRGDAVRGLGADLRSVLGGEPEQGQANR